VEVLWRTLIADTFAGVHPAPKEVGDQFLAHVVVLCMNSMIRYKSNNQSAISRLKGRMHNFLLQRWDQSMNEKRVTPWIKLLKSDPQSEWSAWYSRFLEMFPQVADSLVEGEVEHKAKGIEGAVTEQAKEAWARSASPYGQFRHESNLALSFRRLFRTRGKLLGFGPRDLELGDEVWILAGAKTPVVLRHREGTMELLGEGYVHGAMHGEVEDMGIELKDVVLE
jgi:hypothetical protein